MSNEGYHEPIEELTDAVRDMHRAITSLMEELEAVDWYNQRVAACKDEELRAGTRPSSKTLLMDRRCAFIPSCREISLAMAILSPVIIFTEMPCSSARLMVSAESSRGGS